MLDNIDAAYYLVHSMADDPKRFSELVPDHTNLSHFGCVKASGLDDRKLTCIDLILANLRSSNRESFHASQKGYFSPNRGIHKSTQIKVLLGGKTPENVVADKAYDSNEIRAFIAGMGSQAVIPCNASRIKLIEYDIHIYKERCLVEIFFSLLNDLDVSEQGMK